MIKTYLIFSLLVLTQILHAQTIIKLAPGISKDDKRHVYSHRILKEALDATVTTHGKYLITYAKEPMSRGRALLLLKEGTTINVHEAPTRNEWEEAVLPVRVPIRKGLLGYRLFLINEKRVKEFANLSSIPQLKNLKAGSGTQWSITKVMKALNFELVTGSNYDGLFSMLDLDRFDYFPRGINEIYNELSAKQNTFPNMVIEPTKALYITTPTYLFVSPQYPKLAQRIKKGLDIIIDNGVFEFVFKKYLGGFLNKSNLQNRLIFTIDNPLLSKETPLNIEKYWIKL
ncbi:MAG: transporter substrate-binding domain-containing protein [Fibrobacterales bacterium]